ncbi:MAG: DUF1080 domain-containing protein [Planctomycetales bacterium]
MQDLKSAGCPAGTRTGRSFFLALSCLAGMLAAWSAAAAPSAADEQPDADGFVSLFDGRTLEGWEGDKQLWKVEEGAIVGDSPGIKHNEFLATTRRYGDFELRLEFRLRRGEGNTGVQFRSERVPDSSEVSGYQADIGEKYWGCLYDESRRNKILAQAPAELQKALKPDDWNSYVIRAVGDRITLTLNGIKTVEYRETDENIPRTGIIALQVHSGPPLRVEFRKLRLREVKSAS